MKDDGDMDGDLWMCGWCLRCRYGQNDRQPPRGLWWHTLWHLTQLRPVITWHRVILLDRKDHAR